MEKKEIHSHGFFFFREITSLVKTLLSRIFCQKRLRVNFRNFHTVMRHHVSSLPISSFGALC